MFVNLFINSKKTSELLSKFVKDSLKKAGFSRLVVGLSGGVDSATACALAVNTIGKENVYVGIFPYGRLNKEGADDAKIFVKKFSIPPSNTHVIDIKSIVDAASKHDSSITKIRKGNVMARVRMLLLYDIAKKHKTLVLGTENKTENKLGYFTRFGDEASDIEPLIGLYKTQVRQLASFLDVPERIIVKSPSAGFWKGQTDEKEMGFSYENADKVLHLHLDQHKSKEEIIRKGFDREVVEKILDRMKENEFKHILPYITVKKR